MEIIGKNTKKKESSVSSTTDINLDHRPHIMDQFRKFAKDDKYFELYKGHELGINENLVRLFSYSPPEKFRTKLVLNVPSQLEGAGSIERTYFNSDIVMPYGKIIIPGEATEGTQYKAGDIITLFSSRVSGDYPNPEWQRYWQAKDGQLGMSVKNVEPHPTISGIEVNYKPMQYVRVGNLYPDEADKLTYLLPSFEIRKYTGL